jgi:hypothetical protein
MEMVAREDAQGSRNACVPRVRTAEDPHHRGESRQAIESTHAFMQTNEGEDGLRLVTTDGAFAA